MLSKEERFWTYVDKSGDHWLWTGGTTPFGYGNFGNEGAHRYAWKLTNGPIPEGLFVLHTCDIPQCVYPGHLWLGTPADNMRDKMSKGRGNYESRRGTVLTADDVEVIRASPESGAELGRRYGVTRQAIWRVRNL
jgi:hypothetical protein